jgi:hypothetical protein
MIKILKIRVVIANIAYNFTQVMVGPGSYHKVRVWSFWLIWFVDTAAVVRKATQKRIKVI